MATLIIGNKNYSTWSFRAWWVLKQAGIEFHEIMVPLYENDHQNKLNAYGPTGQAPVYLDDHGQTIWDSLAICETIAETHPQLWPAQPAARARARSLCAEMHAGFFGIRSTLHMNCRASGRHVDISTEIEKEIARVTTIVTGCRREVESGKSGHPEGPWLFGRFSIADAMFAPLLFSFQTYGIDYTPIVSAYAQTIMENPHVQAWFDAARSEKEYIAICEAG